MISNRTTLLRWVEQGVLPRDKIPQAFALTTPSPRAWADFLESLFLWAGALCLGSAVICFIAYNWTALGHAAKFGLVEALLVGSMAAYWRLGSEKLAGKGALLFASLCLGGLLALYGQTYQMGADPWELFAGWAALILPWVFVGQFAALWIFWMLLLNVAAGLYLMVFHHWFNVFFDERGALLLHFTLNTAALAVWEIAAPKIEWLRERWAPRLLAVASGWIITWLAVHSIFDSETKGTDLAIYLAWVAAFYAAYRYRVRDLFMLAGQSLSLIITITSLASEKLLHSGSDAIVFLLIGILVIGMAAAAANWLRRLATEWRQ